MRRSDEVMTHLLHSEGLFDCKITPFRALFWSKRRLVNGMRHLWTLRGKYGVSDRMSAKQIRDHVIALRALEWVERNVHTILIYKLAQSRGNIFSDRYSTILNKYSINIIIAEWREADVWASGRTGVSYLIFDLYHRLMQSTMYSELRFGKTEYSLLRNIVIGTRCKLSIQTHF